MGVIDKSAVLLADLASGNRIWKPYDASAKWRLKKGTRVNPITVVIAKRAKALDEKITDIPWHINEKYVNVVDENVVARMEGLTFPIGWHTLYVEFPTPIQDNGFIIFGFLCSSVSLEQMTSNRKGEAT
jgi:hypothetical protein